MAPHWAHQRLEIITSHIHLVLMAVELEVRGEKYHFLDMEFNQVEVRSSHSGSVCWEGVWGRTSCFSSHDPVDAGAYDLGVDGCFSNNFPMNLYISKH
jgi:hypothetical protein